MTATSEPSSSATSGIAGTNEPETKTLSHMPKDYVMVWSVSAEHEQTRMKSRKVVHGMKQAHAMSATMVRLRRGENRL